MTHITPASPLARPTLSEVPAEADAERTQTASRSGKVPDAQDLSGPATSPQAPTTPLTHARAPLAAFGPTTLDGAHSFAENVRSMETSRSGDGLLVEFLKLQMLDDTQQQMNDVLSNLGSLACRVAAHGGSSIMSIMATNQERAGKSTQDAIHRFQEEAMNSRNDLMALLAGLKPDQQMRSEGFVEVDELRREVASLVLDLADRHAATQRSTELR